MLVCVGGKEWILEKRLELLVQGKEKGKGACDSVRQEKYAFTQFWNQIFTLSLNM